MRLALVLAVLAGAVLGVAWAATPGVADAQQRVAARLTAHGATALDGAVPAKVADALIATEDSRFRTNGGVDWRGVLRQPWGLVTGQDLGGATLEQQLAKNVYEDGENGPVEKVRAVALALKLDRAWSKDQLLRMYLDDGYYGHGFHGLADAAQGYFGVPADQLTWAQSTVLAGLFQAPSAYDPLAHPERARARQAHVLDRLVAVGTLTRAQADAVAQDDWGLVGR
ncbi:biosynthetic peptidoglycan transglycosylase [Modestobacter sp. NPDC049651]|uniref:biosynthetic peptidoglycan transglycosylase n=1 Tax=unclassified Modestobacter TaxID=2643866 RepID=UPI0033DCA7F5